VSGRLGDSTDQDGRSSSDTRPSLDLALACTRSPWIAVEAPECEWLARRAPSAGPAIVHAIRKCPAHIAPREADSFNDELCAGRRMHGMFGVLAQQGGVALDELDRWARRRDADYWLRAAAARALAEVRDDRAFDVTSELLDLES